MRCAGGIKSFPAYRGSCHSEQWGHPWVLKLEGPLEFPSPDGETEAQSREPTRPRVPQSVGSTAHAALPFPPGPHLPLRQPALPFPDHLQAPGGGGFRPT